MAPRSSGAAGFRAVTRRAGRRPATPSRVRSSLGCRRFAEELPRAAHVILRRTQVADGEVEHEAPVEIRVGKERLAGRVDPLQNRLVLTVAPRAAKADRGERVRRGDLPARLLL